MRLILEPGDTLVVESSSKPYSGDSVRIGDTLYVEQCCPPSDSPREGASPAPWHLPPRAS